MAKAQISLPSGVVVNVTGTPDEITSVVSRLQGEPVSRSKPEPLRASKRRMPKPGRVQITDLIGNLIDGGFFKKPKNLAAVKQALAEAGHHYPVTTLSPTMLRQVRKKNLRRLKQDGHWIYTG